MHRKHTPHLHTSIWIINHRAKQERGKKAEKNAWNMKWNNVQRCDDERRLICVCVNIFDLMNLFVLFMLEMNGKCYENECLRPLACIVAHSANKEQPPFKQRAAHSTYSNLFEPNILPKDKYCVWVYSMAKQHTVTQRKKNEIFFRFVSPNSRFVCFRSRDFRGQGEKGRSFCAWHSEDTNIHKTSHHTIHHQANKCRCTYVYFYKYMFVQCTHNAIGAIS